MLKTYSFQQIHSVMKKIVKHHEKPILHYYTLTLIHYLHRWESIRQHISWLIVDDHYIFSWSFPLFFFKIGFFFSIIQCTLWYTFNDCWNARKSSITSFGRFHSSLSYSINLIHFGSIILFASSKLRLNYKIKNQTIFYENSHF